MAVIAATKDLDVLDKYLSLIKESLGADSVYIRAKETIQELVESGDLDAATQAKVIADVLSNLNNSLVNTSMSTAMQWAAQEKDIELKKLELAKQLDILDEEILLKQRQVSKLKSEDESTQAQTIRTFGFPTVIDGSVTALTDSGKMYEDIEMAKQQRALASQQTTNAVKEGLLLDGKKTESQVAIHKVVADTYRNYGHYTFDVSDAGVTNVTPGHGTYTTLSDTQQIIAEEQAKGYAYNAWANALTGSSNMIAAAITGGVITDFEQIAGAAEGTWVDTLNDLKSVTPPTL